MKKVAIFYRTFWKSISSLTYYHDVIKARFSFSLKYFLAFSLVLGLFLTILISSVIVPTLRTFTTRLSERAGSLYPRDLVIEIKNGQLSTNVLEPIHFPIPLELFMDVAPAITDQKQIYLVTIDTQKKPGDFPESKSILFVTKEAIVVSEGTTDQNYRVYSLKEFENIRIDQANVQSLIKRMQPVLRLIPYLFMGGVALLCLIFLPLSRLLFLLFTTILLLPAAQLMKLPITYKKLFQLGLHGLTLPTLIQMGLLFLGLTPPVPFFATILFYLYMLVILAELRKSSVQK